MDDISRLITRIEGYVEAQTQESRDVLQAVNRALGIVEAANRRRDELQDLYDERTRLQALEQVPTDNATTAPRDTPAMPSKGADETLGEKTLGKKYVEGDTVDSAEIRSNESSTGVDAAPRSPSAPTVAVEHETLEGKAADVSEYVEGDTVDSAEIRRNESSTSVDAAPRSPSAPTVAVEHETLEGKAADVSEYVEGDTVDSAEIRSNESSTGVDAAPRSPSAPTVAVEHETLEGKAADLPEFVNPSQDEYDVATPKWLIVAGEAKTFTMKVYFSQRSGKKKFIGYYNGDDRRRTWLELFPGENIISPNLRHDFSHNSNFAFVIANSNRRSDQRQERTVQLKFVSKSVDVDRDLKTSAVHIGNTCLCPLWIAPSKIVAPVDKEKKTKKLLTDEYREFQVIDTESDEALLNVQVSQKFSVPITFPIFWRRERH